MIDDGDELTDGAVLRGRLVVVGGGPAGIVIALELARAGMDVILLESGGAKFDPRAQALSDAAHLDSERHAALSLTTRRQIGGGSVIWGGRCVPFDPIDFDDRTFVSDARWPLDYTAIVWGEQERIAEFWSHYEAAGQQMRLACRESLFELRRPLQLDREVSGLRRANLDELELIIPIQARMAQDESGINPLENDPEGFRQRCRRRIEQGRTWVLIDEGELLFKADVISDTPEVIYLEGVWTNERLRGTGNAVSCISQLAKELLQRTKALSLLVDERNMRAQAFYRKCGFRFLTTYDTIFLEQEGEVTLN